MADRCSPGLRLLAAPPDEEAARLRRELKFELPDADFRKIHGILRVNHRRLAYAGRESVVHSIYFDDPRLSSCAHSVAGAGRRVKLRLRWYDSPLPNEVAFLEVKRRFYELVGKRRFAVASETGLREIRYRELVGGLIRLLQGEARELLLARRMPVVLIRYRRRHYRDRRPGSPIRLTVDRQITVFDQIGAAAPRIHFGVPLPGRVVLEIKCPPTDKAPVPELLFPLRPRRTRCSKYVLACRLLAGQTGVEPASYL